MNHSNHLKIMLTVVAGFVVLAALGVPVMSNLPLLAIVLVCPLMMFFMMRGMNHGAGSNRDDAGPTPDADRVPDADRALDADRAPDADRTAADAHRH